MVLAVMLCARSVSAENKFYIEPFTISSYDVVNVPVMLENTGINPTGFQFDVVLPAELEFAGEPTANPARLTNVHSLFFNAKNGRVLSYSSDRQTINGTEGELLTVPVKVKTGMLTENTEVKIGIVDAALTTALGEQTVRPEDTEATVTLQAFTAVGYSPAAEVVAVPGSAAVIEFALSNNCNVLGMQVDFVLPEGFTADASGLTLGTRCAAGIAKSVTANAGNVYTVQLFSAIDNNMLTGNDGVVFTLAVNVPEDMEADAATVTVKNLDVSYAAGKSITGEPFEVQIVNGMKVAEAANTEIEALEQELTKVLQQIAEECADVAEDYTGSEVYQQISALRTAVDNAFEDGTLKDNYDEIMKPVDDIRTAISTLLTDAQEAEKQFKENERVAANQAAYEAAMAEADKLQEAVDAAKNELAKDYPGIDLTAEIEAAQAAVNAQIDNINKALEAVENEGSFEYTVDATDTEAAIATAKKAAADEAKRQADNQAAYEATVDAIDALETKLDDAIAKIASDYPSANVSLDVMQAQKAIDKARSEAAAALEAVDEEGEYDYTLDSKAIEDMIAAILEKAEQSGIEIITVDNLPADAKLYNLQGIQVSRPAAGSIVIVRMADGNVCKAVVR